MTKILGVLVSGRGSNLQSIMDAIALGQINARIGIVISDKPDVYALERARVNNIPTAVVDYKKCGQKQIFERKISALLDKHTVDLVVLAGFMRILSPDFVKKYHHRMMNIHPALLPSFPGLSAQAQALNYGVKISGCTVHFVDEGMDTGPIILQAAVPVLDNDTVDDLAARILEQEHIIYPQAVKLFCEDKLVIKDRKVFILDK